MPKSCLKATTVPGITSAKTFDKIMFGTEMIMNKWVNVNIRLEA
jgi:hypothetical protein